jgi:hypothetical protein
MDLSSLGQLARTQGPLFWTAVTAIALGATLLVVALVQMLRASRAARVGPGRAGATPDSPGAAAAVGTGVDRLDGADPARGATEPHPAREEIAVDPADRSLALLLRRLQAAGDRLEELAGDLEEPPAARQESALKEGFRDVEYVFKASGP